MLETERLILRQWCDDDKQPFAALNADPIVMQYYPSTLSTSESDALAEKTASLIAAKGWGFWALESKADKRFIGFTGLHQPEHDLPCMPCVETGWRLARNEWGKGYATEAARAALQYAFDRLHLAEVVAFATVENRRSQAVMRRLDMVDTKQNFLHPGLPPGHPLQEHVLYKINRQAWSPE